MAQNPEGVALLLQSLIDSCDPEEVDYQDPHPAYDPLSPGSVRFELKINDQIFWVRIEEGF